MKRLVFLYGLPGVGKLTVARELAAQTGYRLFHNHLTVDLLLSVFEFGSEPFVELREWIWLSVFQRIGQIAAPGVIFTFAPEATVRSDFVGQVRAVAENTGIEVRFVELVCPLDELRQRIDTPSRRQAGKLTSLAFFDQLHGAGVFASSHMPKPDVTVDTAIHAPPHAAARIAAALGIVSAASTPPPA